VAGIIQFEQEWDQNKLEKTLRTYFNKGAKNLPSIRSNSLWELINTYADNVFSSLFAGLGSREWLYMGQADFILVLDAGIKDNFPREALIGCSQLEFEQMVLAAHDRAFEEQRFGPILTEAMSGHIQGPKTKRRVWNAVEQGRKEAASTSVQMEDFAACWINKAIAMVSEEAHGDPESVMTMDTAVALFNSLIEGGGLPLAMTQDAGPPPAKWPLIEEAVQTAYITHTAFHGEAAAGVAETAGALAPPSKIPLAFRAAKQASWGPAAMPVAHHALLNPYSKGKGKGKAAFSAW
jgi:hypothetical protein